ncbi:MAG: phosphoenolpyruvate phosphomutase [Thermoanaerobaculia bacterium]|nr:phosphoenolpyruvate phosphomutase [Thermoanaerobaculia bacterium]
MFEGATILRRRLANPEIIRLAGAHNALSAKMAERAGFEGVWASGFEIAASYAVPDASIVTMSEHLALARSMCDAVKIPVVVDCDTGYGDELQFAHAVRQFEAAGVAGVCVEDKQFPKRNSFSGGRQELVPIDAFVEKLHAGKQAQRTRDFAIIARTEALIAGCDIAEALLRARTYADAGADAVLIHSKARTAAEIAQFAMEWDRPIPLVAVPTTYYDTPLNELAALGIKVVIYANQGLRCALKAMERVYAEILRSGSTASVEDELWPMQTIFKLQGVANGEKRDATPAPATTPTPHPQLPTPRELEEVIIES